MNASTSTGALRATALIALLAGAAGSFGLMRHVGHGNNSLVLMTLFTVWDLSPFAALILADMGSKRSSLPRRVALYIVMLVITVASLAIYANVAFGPPRPQPAFMFLAVPLASWLLIAIVLPLAASFSRGR